MVTEVLEGGKFYIQSVADQKVAAIQKQLSSLSLQEAPIIGAFNPKKGDIVLAQFSADKSWNRAMVRGTALTFLEYNTAMSYNMLPSNLCGPFIV